MAKQTRVSSLLASQRLHIGYICSTPQVFVMTDLEKDRYDRVHESKPCAARSGVRVRHARIFMAKRTRVSSLLAS